MKNLSFFLSFFLFIVSCDKQDGIVSTSKMEESKSVIYNQVEGVIPIDYPENFISYTPNDLELIGSTSTSNKKVRQTSSKKPFNDIVDEVLRKYPSFETFDPKSYKKYFPKMNEVDISNNREDILLFIEKLMAYEVAKKFSEEGDGDATLKRKNKNSRSILSDSQDDYSNYSLWQALTQCETWYYAAHLRMNQAGIYTSRDVAYTLQNNKFTSSTGDDAADAFRHGIWATLVGKYACYRYYPVSNAADVAKGFVDSHECNQNDIYSDMDKHNNVVSVNYYKTIATPVKINAIDWDVKVNTSDENIGTYIGSVPCVLKTTRADVQGTSYSNLVKVK